MTKRNSSYLHTSPQIFPSPISTSSSLVIPLLVRARVHKQARMQILRTSTNPLYLDITWTTLALFFWRLSFQSVWPIIQFSSKTIFSTHPDLTEIYTTSSPKTPLAFLPRSPIASRLPPTMWALFIHSFHPLPLYLAVLSFLTS